MKREQMEHILRAAAAITNEKDFVVIGSQALLASFPEMGQPFDRSMELDLFPASNPAAADMIDGSIGELSPFDEAFGYYAHGVGPETAVLPRDWRERAVIVENANTGGARGICISPSDVAVSKLAAGRDKDIQFVQAMLEQGLVDKPRVDRLLAGVSDVALRETIRQRLARL